MKIATKNTKRHKEKIEFLFVSLCVFCGHSIHAETVGLEDLHDIVMPEPVSAWPPAPGVWVVLLLMVGGIAYFLIRRISAYRKNAYRRAALTELAQVESASGIAEILRRVAIHAHGRETVTALKGDDWFQWLEVQGGFQGSEKVRLALASVYSDEAVEPNALRQFTEQWIREHTC